MEESPSKRCMALAGDVWSGPQYCGYRAVGPDANGRLCCKRHLDKQLGCEWLGDRARYPAGPGGNWKWRHGKIRGAQS